MPKITISVEFDSHEDAIMALSTLRGGDNAVTGLPKNAKDKAKEAGADPKPSVTKTDKPAASSPGASSAGASEAATSGGASYDDVAAKIKGAVDKNRAEVLATLTAFGAKSGKDLKPEQYADFVAKLDAAITPPAGDDLT